MGEEARPVFGAEDGFGGMQERHTISSYASA